MIEEIWKPITGYEDLYEVSNLGRVKRLEHRIWVTHSHSKLGGYYTTLSEKILKPCFNRRFNNYNVGLYLEHKRKTFSIARLVALEFVANPNNFPDVIHLHNKLDNRVENLIWGTDFDSGRIAVNRGKYISRFVRCVETGEIFRNAKDVEKKYNFDSSCVHRACKGKYKTAYGYHWEYVE